MHERLKFIVGPALTAAVAMTTVWLIDGAVANVPAPAGLAVLTILLATYLGGMASGFLSTAIAFGFALVFFSEPAHFAILSTETKLRLALFVIVAPSLVVAVGIVRRRSRARLTAEIAHRARVERVNEELKTLHAALDQIDDGIVLLDRKFEVEFMNRAVLNLSRLPEPKSAQKAPFAEFIERMAENSTSPLSPQQMRERVEGHMAWIKGSDPRPVQIRLADGRVALAKRIVLQDGARMLTYADVTDAVRHVDELEALASVDGMTGLYNRRHFLALADAEWSRFLRYQRPMSLLMLDIDRFKSVNDRFGHGVGDTVIKTVADICRSNGRESDIIARIGGDELVMLLPETDATDARVIAERVCRTVSEHQISGVGDRGVITISVGVAAANADLVGIEDLLKQADAALYEAKRAGRNRVMAAPPRRIAQIPATAA